MSTTSSPSTPLLKEAARLLWPYRYLSLIAMLAGVFSGVSTAWLLGLLNTSLHSQGEHLTRALLYFGGLCLLVLGSGALASIGNSIVGQRVIADLRKAITAKVLCAPIDAIARFRSHRVLATLHHDIDTVSAFTFNLSGFVVALAMTIGSLAYLAWLSPTLFSITLVAILIGLLINYAAGQKWTRNYDGVRDAEDILQKGYGALTQGAKELRMNRERRQFVYRHELSRAVDDIRDLKIGAMRAFWGAQTAGGVLFFVAIGATVAVGTAIGTSASVLSGFALVLLYVKGPLEQVVGALPGLAQATVSFRKIAELAQSFATPESELLLVSRPAMPAKFERIELRSVGYEFPAPPGGKVFRLGPIDLALHQGETLFITGENGCGKTTLLMLLLGLYEPSSGHVFLDGSLIQAAARDDYRQFFSAVFFDYALFEHRLGTSLDAASAQAYLERLELAEKVQLIEGAPSTIDLSAGQRKRLALIQAYLEARPILVFDEWAAEQDPTFRRVFYTEILPDLKRQNKTLIVISHDDRYFHLADRRIVMTAGQISVIEAPASVGQRAS